MESRVWPNLCLIDRLSNRHFSSDNENFSRLPREREGGGYALLLELVFHKEQHKITTPLDTPKAERITTPQPPPPPTPIPPSLCNIKEMAESALSRLREVSRGKVHQKLDRGECDFSRQTWDGEGGSAQVRSTSFLFCFFYHSACCIIHCH